MCRQDSTVFLSFRDSFAPLRLVDSKSMVVNGDGSYGYLKVHTAARVFHRLNPSSIIELSGLAD